LGAERSTGTPELIDALPTVEGIVPRRIDNHIIQSMSDYDAFMKAGIPFLFYTAGRSEHYHAPTDTPDRLDYDKMVALAIHLTDLVTALADRPDTPAFVAEGFDDAATVASVRSLLDALAPYAPAPEGLQPIVSAIEQRLATNGSLSTMDRQLIARLVVQLETSLR
ncbi:MAG: M28 family peptidase, partial [Actinomycetia bacterium]|nr:M28 family peptidase [Actinomycetes bacterium]